MNIRQLETFLRVVELGSFGAAASALHATQSTISTRIRDLERSLGIVLFDRSPQGVQLTPSGHELVGPARHIMELTRGISHRIGDPMALTGLLRMGVAGRIAHTWLPRFMAALHEHYPRVTFKLDISLAGPMSEKVRNGDLDMALMPFDARSGLAGLDAVSLGYEEFVWMAPSGFDLPARRLSPEDLAGWPLLGLSDESPHYAAIEQWFSDAGASYRPLIGCNSMAAVAELAAAGMGICLLHRISYSHLVRDGRLRVLDTQPPITPIEFVAVARPGYRDPLVAAALAMAVQFSEFPPRRAALRPGKS